jgi:hypothetical protein
MEICRKALKIGEDERTVVYYVTIDDLSDTATGIVLETYGVGVTICEIGETKIIPNVTFSETAILTLINLLASHLVTPVAVPDVVDDWLCTC